MNVKEIPEMTKEVTEIVNDVKSIQLIFITRYKRKGEYEYDTHYPILGQSLNAEIIDIIIKPLLNNIQGYALDYYDPTASIGGTIEYIEQEEVKESQKILEKINDLHESDKFSLKDIDNNTLLGYCLKFTSANNIVVYCFKKFTNTKLLEKKKLFWAFVTTGATLEKITYQPLIIDERIDCVLYDGVFYVNNRYLFEMLFGLNEEYRRNIYHILSQISQKDIIVNMEAFSTECKNAKLAQRRLIKIASTKYEAINILKNDTEKMVNLIKEHNLALDISSDNKIVYNEGDNVEPILRLLDGGLITKDVTGSKGHASKFSRPLEN